MQTEILLNTIEEQSQQPSLFELVILEKMEGMIQPALRHLYSSFAIYLNRTEWLDYYDSLYFILFLSMNAVHLLGEKTSSFIESINGLRRVSSSTLLTSPQGSVNGSGLSSFQKGFSFAYLMIMPRLVHIIQTMREDLRQLESDDRSSTLSYCKYLFLKVLVQVLEYGVAIEQVSVMVMRLLYVFQWSPYHHPLFALLQMKLIKSKHRGEPPQNPQSRKISRITYRRFQPEVPHQHNNVSSSPSQKNWQMSLLLGLILTMRAAEWLLNNDLASEHLTTRLTKKIEIPPYPKPVPVARGVAGTVVPPADRRLCPLCSRLLKNPCAASSGYVFCYDCILDYVRERKVCPITQLNCQEKDLIRLFES